MTDERMPAPDAHREGPAIGPTPPGPGLGLAPGPRPNPARPEGPQGASFYDAIGGHDTFVRLVDRFYEGVAADDLLRPMYPEEDLAPAKVRLTMFLEQYWGGPTTYSDLRGHPRLRMRHSPYAVTTEARDRWLRHMRDAVDSLGLAPMHESTLWDYLERAAFSLVNSMD